jgi:PhnB protein
MTNQANPVPEGYQSVAPYLIVRGGADALAFYQQAFGATELLRLHNPHGLISHAELLIGDSTVMLTDEKPEFPDMRSPQALGGSPAHLHLYVADADAVVDAAVAAGATLLMPVTDQGEDRRGGVTDPFGHVWWIATRVEQVSREELQRRYDATRDQQPA